MVQQSFTPFLRQNLQVMKYCIALQNIFSRKTNFEENSAFSYFFFNTKNNPLKQKILGATELLFDANLHRFHQFSIDFRFPYFFPFFSKILVSLCCCSCCVSRDYQLPLGKYKENERYV